jgi:hypothetical protein
MNPNQLRKLSRKSFGWAITSTILLTINVSLSLYVAWVYHQISLYGHIFGWGNIPLEVFPIPPEQVEGVFKVIGWLGVATVLSALGAFLFCRPK